MSVLTGPEIERVVNRTAAMKAAGLNPPCPAIEIEPFDPARCGPNSYDVRIANTLKIYRPIARDVVNPDGSTWRGVCLDSRSDNPTADVPIPPTGLLLFPGRLYLGSTVERMRCDGLVPWIDGRSSIGRLGESIHVTAGRGDDGWAGHWTLEITVVETLLVYPDEIIGQVTFLTLDGERRPYKGKYQEQDGAVASRLHLDHKGKQ